jgi:antitoxin-like ribbon-helix-helix protein
MVRKPRTFSVSAPASGPRRRTPAPRSPSRAGRRGITFYVEPELWKQLRRLSLEIDKTLSELMEESAALLLEKHAAKRS